MFVSLLVFDKEAECESVGDSVLFGEIVCDVLGDQLSDFEGERVRCERLMDLRLSVIVKDIDRVHDRDCSTEGDHLVAVSVLESDADFDSVASKDFVGVPPAIDSVIVISDVSDGDVEMDSLTSLVADADADWRFDSLSDAVIVCVIDCVC